MIDLTNKTADEVNELIQKYAPLLELTKNRKEISFLAYVLDIAIKYINTNHKEAHIDQRAWAATIIRRQYLDGKIKKESDITETIDDFFQYIKDEFQAYVGDMIPASQYDLEAGFVHLFIMKKNGSQ